MSCQKSVRPDKAVKCQECNNLVHYDCKAGYSQLTLADKTNLCICVSCVAAGISANIKLTQANRELKAENVKLKALVDKLSSLETEITCLKQKFDSLHQTFTSQQAPPSPSNPTEEFMYDTYREFQNRESRKLNLVISGITELNQDERMVNDLIKTQLSIADVDITNCRRLGHPGTRPRPLLVSLKTMKLKREILSRAPSLRSYTTPENNRVYINPDFTPQQRQNNSLLREQLKQQRQAGDLVKIHRGKIVPVSPPQLLNTSNLSKDSFTSA